MPSVMAIVSKAVFEKEARDVGVGDVWATDNYASKGKGLSALETGGDLYLVTVRPPEQLWLVAILREPRATATGWQAEANDVPVRVIDGLRSQIKFASGVGITAKAGALGMSLQTPRALTDDDVALLEAGPKPAARPAAVQPVRRRAVKPEPVPPKKTTAPKAVTAPAAKDVTASSTAARRISDRALDDALAHATSGSWPAALGQVLDRWRAAPHREIADVIAAIGVAIPRVEPANWLALAKQRAPETLDALLATIFDDGSIKARDRVEALVAWPADPRIDRWVAGLFEKPVYTSTGARPLWTKIQPLTKRILDNAAIETIAKARAGKWKHVDFTTDFLEEYVDRAKLEARPERALASAEAAVEQPAKLVGTSSTKPATGKRADELLAQFLATPDDDALRLVLADALLEAGDPRGELITLQLAPPTPAGTKRIHQLIEGSRDQLLGPLADAIAQDATFAKGFLARATLKRATRPIIAHAIAASAGHPLWATVEHLEGPGDAEVSRHPVMRSLRSLAASELPIAELAKLPHLEALACTSLDDKAIDALLAKGFESLTTLDVEFREIARFSAPLVRRVLTSPKFARLARLQLRLEMTSFTGFDDRVAMEVEQNLGIGELFALVPKVKIPDVTIRLVRSREQDASSVFRLVREAGKLAVGVTVTTMREHYEAFVRGDILFALDAIAKLSPASVVLDKPPRDKAVRKAVEARIAKF